jgi:hypothetical protein
MRARCFAALAVAVLLLAATVPAGAAWEVKQASGACYANGPSDRDARLSVVAFGPQTFLLISADSFPHEKGSYSIALRFDGGAPQAFNAEGHDATYGIPLTPLLYNTLHDSARLDVSNGRDSYGFALTGIVTAIDDALGCAGQGSYAALRSHAPQPIPGADWQLIDPMAETHDCSVRRNGDSIDTSLALNKTGDVLLVAGRADWAMPGAVVQATLQIGDAAPVAMKGGVFTSVVIVKLDNAQVAALTAAKSLKWTFDWGRFDADVTGIGQALDALRACQAKRQRTP